MGLCLPLLTLQLEGCGEKRHGQSAQSSGAVLHKVAVCGRVNARGRQGHDDLGQFSLFTVPHLPKPPSGRCMAEKASRVLSTAALTVSESLPRRRFSVVDQSEHFTAKPPLKKQVFVQTLFGGDKRDRTAESLAASRPPSAVSADQNSKARGQRFAYVLRIIKNTGEFSSVFSLGGDKRDRTADLLNAIDFPFVFLRVVWCHVVSRKTL